MPEQTPSVPTTDQPRSARPEAAGSPAGTRHPGARVLVIALGALIAVVATVVLGAQAVSFAAGVERADDHAVLPASVARIEVTTSSGDVTVTGTGDSQGFVDARLSGTLRAPRLVVDIDGTTAKVSVDCGVTFVSRCAVRLRVAVPPGVAVRARASSGNVNAEGLRGPFDLSTSSGDVRASGGTGTGRLSTSSGDVTATALGATALEARTGSGDVDMTFAVAPDTVTAHSSSGDVQVTLPNSLRAYDVTAHSSSGDESARVRSDPDSPYKINASTSSGNAQVGYAQPARD